ncbi:MAG: MoxR family ATPase [Spirochaetales bacterium]|nr:MoxR family ATPase [Spirochaetales bacterium]
MTALQKWADKVTNEIKKNYYGKDEAIRMILITLLCRGHLLIEDKPGTGKTLLARSLASVVGGDFKSIQCTPDLLPADVLGVSVYNEEKQKFLFRRGPVVTNLLLVDEVNRAAPRTQSALLEAMAEGQISVEGRSISLPDPFFLIATESSIETEGTFPLPEVQKDRFFLTLTLGYPGREEERWIMKRSGPAQTLEKVTGLEELKACQEEVLKIHVDEKLREYILSLIELTRTEPTLAMGVSPRGSLALYRSSQALAALKGRDFVTPGDIQTMIHPVLKKRLLFKAGPYGNGPDEGDFINNMLNRISVPPID